MRPFYLYLHFTYIVTHPPKKSPIWKYFLLKTCSSFHSASSFNGLNIKRSLLLHIREQPTAWLTNGQAIRWAKLTRVHKGSLPPAWCLLKIRQSIWQGEQSLLHTKLSELAQGCWLCNKAFNGHTAFPHLPGANTKSLFMSLAQMSLTYSFHSGGWCIHLQAEIHINSCCKSDMFLLLYFKCSLKLIYYIVSARVSVMLLFISLGVVFCFF